MEFYLSFHELLGRSGNSLALIFLPLFLVMTVLELIILYWQGTYPWKNAGVSVLVTVGHFITQAAVHGLIFGIIAAFVYKFRLTTIPVSFHNWISLIVLFLLVDLGFYVEHRCSYRIRFLWASHSVHHSSDKMQRRPRFACHGRRSCPACFCSICRSSGSATTRSGYTASCRSA